MENRQKAREMTLEVESSTTSMIAERQHAHTNSYRTVVHIYVVSLYAVNNISLTANKKKKYQLN